MAGAINSWDATKPAGTDYIDASDEMIRANWAALEVMTGAILQNLEVTNGATPATQVSIDADRVALFNTDSPPLCYVARSVSLTADIEAAVGPNGPENATLEAADKWIYVWVIYDPGADVVASVLSAASDWSSVVKTDISNYTFARLVGAVYNDSSQNFVNFRQVGNRASYKSTQTIGTGLRSDGAWSTPVNISSLVPPIAKRITGYAAFSDSASTGAHILEFRTAADNSGNYPGPVIRVFATAASGSILSSHYFEQELTAQEISYQTFESGTTISVDAYLQGYHIEI